MQKKTVFLGICLFCVALLITVAFGAQKVQVLIYRDPGYQGDWAPVSEEPEEPQSYKTILVTNPNSQDLTDFQVKLVFDPSSDSFFDSCQGGSLLGIWTGNGGQQVPFWVERWTSQQAVLWFKAPQLPASQTVNFRLYCSADRAGTASGAATFEFFDDFASDTGWVSICPQGYTCSREWTQEDGQTTLHLDGPCAGFKHYKNVNTRSFALENGLIVRMRAKTIVELDWGGGLAEGTGITAENWADGWWGTDLYGWENRKICLIYDVPCSGDDCDCYDHSLNNDQWYILENRFTPSSILSAVFTDELVQETSALRTGLSLPSTAHPIVEVFDRAYFDWFLIRKYAQQDPIVTLQ